MARSYRRDARGRFAGGGSGGKRGGSAPSRPTSPRKPRGLVTQRQAVAKGRAKLAAKQADPAASPRSRAAQKGALTKARNQLAAAKQSGRRRIQPGAQAGVLRPGRGGAKPAAMAASSIRPTGGLPRPGAGNAIRPTGGLVKRPANKIVASPRKSEPATIKGKIANMRRVTGQITDSWARRTARDIADATGKGGKATAARIVFSVAPPQELKAARSIIARRAARAAAAAARGSKPAARAAAIYDRQLAPVLPKGKGKAKNSIQPGPRNTKGTPPKKRKPRKR